MWNRMPVAMNRGDFDSEDACRKAIAYLQSCLSARSVRFVILGNDGAWDWNLEVNGVAVAVNAETLDDRKSCRNAIATVRMFAINAATDTAY